MSERDGSISPKDRLGRPKALATGIVGGWMFGVIGEGITTLITHDPETAVKWDHGVGQVSGLLLASFGLSHLSLERVEDFLDEGRKQRASLELCRAILEGALGTGGAGGVIGFQTGIESDSLFRGAVGTIAGAALGGLLTLSEYRKRVRPFPELIIPEGNSVKRETKYIDRKDGVKFPPYFSASSLRDVLEFRDVNKEVIMKWASLAVPNKSDVPATGFRLVSSIFVVDNVRHFPVADPKDSLDMNLYDLDGKKSIKVHPVTDITAGQLFPYLSCFGSTVGEIGDDKYFKRDQWLNEKDRSWRGKVIILAQYQDQKPPTNAFKTDFPTPDRVADNYWLLHIVGEVGKNTGKRKKIRQEVPSRVLAPDAYPHKA